MTSQIPSQVDFSTPYSLPQLEKEALVLSGLNALTEWHRQRCSGYNRILNGVYPGIITVNHMEDLPYLPVRLFKYYELKSVSSKLVVRKLTSSGTTGQQASQIFLDSETSKLQVCALTTIVQDLIGKKRLPMVILDQNEIFSGKTSLGARAAGVLGFSNFGHHHLYALDEDNSPKWKELKDFIGRYQDQPILLFGFTFIVWQHFFQAAKSAGQSLNFGPGSILIHGGGWKRLVDQQVDNITFKKSMHDQFGIERVSNYYGMVEQVGSIFVECEKGYLHVPKFADILMRNPMNLEPTEKGVIQVMSLLPRSYPGHSILTEDLGTIVGINNCQCGRKGKYFLVHGRIPQAEIRGCSDVGRA